MVEKDSSDYLNVLHIKKKWFFSELFTERCFGETKMFFLGHNCRGQWGPIWRNLAFMLFILQTSVLYQIFDLRLSFWTWLAMCIVEILTFNCPLSLSLSLSLSQPHSLFLSLSCSHSLSLSLSLAHTLSLSLSLFLSLSLTLSLSHSHSHSLSRTRTLSLSLSFSLSPPSLSPPLSRLYLGWQEVKGLASTVQSTSVAHLSGTREEDECMS